MLQRQPTLDQVKQAIRTELCAHCPYRAERPNSSGAGMPRRCEAKCPVFVHLPVLQSIAERLDPMIGSKERVVDCTIRRILESNDLTTRGGERNKLARLRHHRRRLARILGRLLNP
jgi:hypothetical protein